MSRVFATGAVLATATALLAGPAARADSTPCGTLDALAAPSSYAHIVVLMDENLTYDNFQSSPQATYLHGLRDVCGSEANMSAATHPSQPNYMATTSGVPSLVGQHTAANNIFSQAEVAGQSWKSYQESMTSNCGLASGFYKPGHNAAFYYTDIAATCKTNDVPLTALDADLASDSLPTVSWITPNACNDTHWQSGCPTASGQRVKAGDNWMASMIPRLTALPSYQSGQTLIIITWDEGDGPGTKGVYCPTATERSCQVPTIVLSPYIKPGTVDTTPQSLYSLLGTMQDILGYPRLAGAQGQPSMRAGLGF